MAGPMSTERPNLYAWVCPRCKKVNAPWLAQCYCGPDPVPATLPGGIRVTQNGSWELRMDD